MPNRAKGFKRMGLKKPKNRKPKTFPSIRDEELIRKAEILLDSGTQKTLRGLAYLRVLRSRLSKSQGSHQLTLTFTPGKGKSKKKKWVMPSPKSIDHPNPEYKLISKCWSCGELFIKNNECKICRLFICPACGKCGCQLSKEARNAVYCVLEAVFGYAGTKRSYWRKV